ncbi:DNA methyltransferase 3-like protein [Leptotrombidium deliense]|uniref:DNA (cytosine-5-)-methyltransferase n=1 Tax=Leptotrombidium deliense TaxID=299467 RepID=A0A443SU14_9ACAR|nr:DNA methyltransferase 3-like protein [Leptotrombidium deliense]
MNDCEYFSISNQSGLNTENTGKLVILESSGDKNKKSEQRSEKRTSRNKSANPLLRGKHGLRPLPPQVDYYQSVLEEKKAKVIRDAGKLYREETQEVGVEILPSKRQKRSSFEVKPPKDDSKEHKKEHFVVGDIVWATLPSYKTWFPGLIISHLHCGQKPARNGQTWVYWFGDHQVSEIPKSKVKSFIAHFQEFSKGTSSLTSPRMKEALQVLATRAGVSSNITVVNEDDSALINWAKDGFPIPPEKLKSGVHAFAPDPANPIPALAACYLPLDAIQQEALKTDDRLQQIAFYEVESAKDAEEVDEPLQIPEFKQSQVERVRKGEIKMSDICIACCCDHNPAADVVSGAKVHHPCFDGLLCKQCQETLRCTMYAPGDDNKNSFCAVCGQVGKLAVCENNQCHRVFCFVCIQLFVGPEEHEKIVAAEKWECYICNPKSLSSSALLRTKSNWRENVKAFYDSVGNLLRSGVSEVGKSPLRVLSLFDGIGGFKVVIEKLQIQTSVYYAYESDRDAVSVSKHHFGDDIKFIDKIEKITPEKIASMCPIDLIVCGFSGNEFCSSTSGRKGFFDAKGSSYHYLYFNHILSLIRLFNKGHHVFFLYENIASMPSMYRDVISHLSMCKPFTLNSRATTVSSGNRYIWSNIPGINRPLPTELQANMDSLTHVIFQETNGKIKSESQGLDVLEMEKLLGFETNYTDINALSKSKRQSLLRKSWSIPITAHILWALCDFFEKKVL